MTRVLEGFAGPGGLSEGARMVGLTDVLGVDLNPDACATAEAAGHRRICGSIRDLNPDDFPKVHTWLSAPPCPTFTEAGKRSGIGDYGLVLDAVESIHDFANGYADVYTAVADPRTALVLETLRFAAALPNVQLVVAEQVLAVEGIWELMAAELTTHNCFESVNVITVRADDLGAATRRSRTFLIATREYTPSFEGLPLRRWWSAARSGPLAAPRLNGPNKPVRFPRTSMAQALGWPPKVRVNTRGDRKTQGGNEFFADGPAPSLTGNGTRTWYRTDLGSVDGRLGSWQAGLLQGFPEDYPWQGSRTSRFQRAADTVSPLVAAAVIGAAYCTPWQEAVWARVEQLYGSPSRDGSGGTASEQLDLLEELAA